MRKPLAALVLAAALLVLGVAFAASATAGDPPVRAAATKTVLLGDNFFRPKSVRVRKNTIVRFTWGEDGAGTNDFHNVRGYRGNRFQSPDKTEGVYRKRITRTTYIVCTIHATTMKGKITVVNP